MMDKGLGKKIIEDMMKEDKNGEKVKMTKREMVLDKKAMHPDESSDAIGLLCDCTGRYARQVIKENKTS